jgi:dTDP-glucose pyrophosphorylase
MNDSVAKLLISPKTGLKEAMKKMNVTGEGILLVVDEENRLLGTLTDGDIRRFILNTGTITGRIDKCFNIAAVFLREKDGKEHAKRLMIQKRLEAIPVVDEHNRVKDLHTWNKLFNGTRTFVKKKNIPVVIMAGGKGERLEPFTKVLPKPLIPIGNKTTIEIIMERFYRYGFDTFIYTLNYKKEYLKLFLKENNGLFPYTIDWVEEESFLGTVGSLSLLRDKLNSTFFVANCDSLLNINFEEVLKWHKEYRAAVTIVGCHNEYKIPFGVLELSNGKVMEVLEKPVHDIIINTGVYVIEPRVISYIPDNTAKDMNELVNDIADKENVTVYPIYDKWLDIGQWGEYRKTLQELEKSSDV